jgi:hypothetical protein
VQPERRIAGLYSPCSSFPKFMIKTFLLVITAAIAIIGCSSSSDAPAGFVLGYSANPELSTNTQPPTEVFKLKVLNNGAAVKGATLHFSIYYTHSIKRDTLPQLSSVSGEFTAEGVTLYDSVTGVTFQAVKDSLKSNTLPWQR